MSSTSIFYCVTAHLLNRLCLKLVILFIIGLHHDFKFTTSRCLSKKLLIGIMLIIRWH